MAERNGRRFSLERRLQWGLALTLGTMFVLLWLATTVTIHKLVEHYLVTRLAHDAEMLTQQLHRGPDGHWHLNWQAVNPIYLRTGSGHYFVIRIGDRTIASPSLGSHPLWAPETPPDNPYETMAGPEETVLVLHAETEKAGTRIRLYVAENHAPIQRYLYWFDGLFTLIALFTVLAAWFWARHLLHQGFASLQPLAAALAESERGQQAFRLPETLPDEVKPLAEALARSLNLLHERLERYRHANADLSHALKTPLQVIFQQLDQPCLARCPEVRDRLRQQAERLRALVERELKQARVAGGVWQASAFRLDRDLPALVQSLRQLYPDRRILWDAPAAVALPLEREDGFELLGNLLDNACKWSRTTVWVAVQQTASGWTLTIEDDGPGVPPAQRARLGQRGQRLDERQPGHGLGLAIVADIVGRYQGTLHFEQSAHGGLQVVVTLPV